MKPWFIGDRGGVDLQYTKTLQLLAITGSFDPVVVSLAEFFRKVGIPAQHLREAADQLEETP
jgi:hypothetical protein